MLALYAQVTAGAAPLAWATPCCCAYWPGPARPPDAGRRAPRAVPDAIRHARALIDEDPAALVTLADLAAACGLSRYQVLRAFTRATGLTPHAYQVQRRLLLARSLIRGGTALAEAAAAGGFADQSHMTRLFVRAYGLSPGRYAQAAG